jgi:hypothetical protein
MANVLAEKLEGRNYEEVFYDQFYSEIFNDDIRHSELDDYKAYTPGKYIGIATRISTYKHGVVEQTLSHNYFVYSGLDAIDELVFDEWPKQVSVDKNGKQYFADTEIAWKPDEIRRLTIISPVSYCGRYKLAKNARFLYALCVEIDNLVKNKYGEQIGLHELLYQIEQERLPRPTYIVASGNGLHLYYKFVKPVPCFDNIKKSLWRYKKQLTKKLWNRYVTYDYQPDRIQYESVFQGFRMVGTRTKAGDVCRAFRTGEPVTIEYLNQFASQKNQIIVEYQTDLPLSKAKELYPEWYQRRIVEGDTTRGHWICNRGLYDWWLNRIMYEAGVGHRYYCLMCLSVYAVKCGIPYEELERDAYSLLQRFELLTDSEENHFTEKDVEAALDMYRNPDEQLYTYTIAYISAHSGIPIERNKRNGRKQTDHLVVARIMREAKIKIGEDAKGGRPVGSNKSQIVANWQKEHPDSKKADCIRETGLDKKTVYKWWNYREESKK